MFHLMKDILVSNQKNFQMNGLNSLYYIFLQFIQSLNDKTTYKIKVI